MAGPVGLGPRQHGIRISQPWRRAGAPLVHHQNRHSRSLRLEAADEFTDVAGTERRVRLRLGREQDEGHLGPAQVLPDPRDPENLVLASGRGILMMRMFMDGVTWNDAGNEVTMTLQPEP